MAVPGANFAGKRLGSKGLRLHHFFIAGGSLSFSMLPPHKAFQYNNSIQLFDIIMISFPLHFEDTVMM